jgi:acyl carrier protein
MPRIERYGMNDNSTLTDVTTVLVQTLGIEGRRDSFDGSTELLGAIPELDSLAILELVTALEEHFDIVVEDADFNGEVFETLGTLSTFVDDKRASVGAFKDEGYA